MDIAEFLEARWAEREAAAKGAPGWKLEHWTAIKYASKDSGRNWRVDAEPRCVVDAVAAEDAEHIALNDPAAVLADIEAKRKLLELAGDADEIERALCDEVARRPVPGELSIGDEIRRALAAPFAAHPDYDPSWRPQP